MPNEKYVILRFVSWEATHDIGHTGLDFTTALTASASAIGNIGPGLGTIGPTDNWGLLTDFAKWLMSFCMLLGRLEIFTVMVLFSRSFWSK